MTLGDLIRNFRSENNLSQADFANRSGLSRGYVSMLENNRNPQSGLPIALTLETMQKAAIAMRISVNELFSLIDQQLDLSVVPNITPTPELYEVPLLGNIACGAPILAEEHIEEYVKVPRHINADFALTCKGDSMINARIFDGDVVYIRKQDTVDNGDIAAVLIDNEATLKRVRIFDDHIVLEPENPLYRPLVYWNEEMACIRILGKATAFTSLIR